jgi:hypothetical protein
MSLTKSICQSTRPLSTENESFRIFTFFSRETLLGPLVDPSKYFFPNKGNFPQVALLFTQQSHLILDTKEPKSEVSSTPGVKEKKRKQWENCSE